MLIDIACNKANWKEMKTHFYKLYGSCCCTELHHLKDLFQQLEKALKLKIRRQVPSSFREMKRRDPGEY